MAEPDSDLAWLDSLDVAVDWISFILSAISVLACGLTLLTFCSFKVLRSFGIKLICFLSFSIMMALIFYLLTFEFANTDLCYPLAIGVHFFFLCNFSWSSVVAFNFYQMIVRRNNNSEALEKWYHVFGWGVPIICVIIVGAFGYYGPSVAVLHEDGTTRFLFCYITNNDALFFALFMPGVTAVCCNLVMFVFVAREIRLTLTTGPQADKRKRRKDFRVYLSIFVSIGLAWLLGFIGSFFPTRSDPDAAAGAVIVGDIINLLFNIAVPLQGFLIFESYCMTDKVYGYWAQLLGIYIPFFQRYEHLGSSRSASRM